MLVFLSIMVISPTLSAEVPPFTQEAVIVGEVTDGLDVLAVRQGSHPAYDRLVFDVVEWEGAGEYAGQPAESAGYISIKPLESPKTYAMELSGYRAFSAAIPEFSAKDRIESITRRTGEQYEDDSTVSLLIRLRKKDCYRAFTLANPARVVLDVGRCP